MKRVLTSLLLVLLLLCGLTDRAGAAVTPLQKTASGSSEENPDKRAYFDPLLVVELQRDRELWGYDLGLGVDVGPNLYAYVRQNPWTYYDPYGLFLGYDSAGDYAREVGQVWVGYGDSIAATATGTWNAVTKPGQTLDGIKAVASDPGAAAKGAWNGVKQAGADLASGDARKQGNVIGGILQAAIPASKAKMLSKLPSGKRKKGGGGEGDGGVDSAKETKAATDEAVEASSEAPKTGVDGKPIKSWESNTSPSLKKEGQKHIETNESMADFQKKLEDRGFDSSQTSSGATQLTNQQTGVSYTVKSQSRTGPPTAYRNGGAGQTHEIRLEQPR